MANAYTGPLLQAFVIFIAAAVLFTIPYILYNYRKYGSIFSLRILVVYSFILYMLCVYCLVILPLPTEAAAAKLAGHRMQLVPFIFVHDMLEKARIVPGDPASYLTLFDNGAFLTLLFNIFMTIPFGMYLRYYFRCSLVRTLVLSFSLSLFFELTQLSGLYFIYNGNYRLFDVDDLLANTGGALLGYWMMGFFARFLPTREDMDRMSLVRGLQVSALRRLVALGYDVLAVVFCLILLRALQRAVWPLLEDPVEQLLDAVEGAKSAAAAVLPGLLSAWAAKAAYLCWRGWRFLEAVVGSSGWYLLYFVLCPALCGGRTLGHRLTRMVLAETDADFRDVGQLRWHRYLLRYGSLFLVMLWTPAVFVKFLGRLVRMGMVSEELGVTVMLISAGGYGLFLLFEFLRMAMHRPLFYERLSRTELRSTVRVGRRKVYREKMSYLKKWGRHSRLVFQTDMIRLTANHHHK